MESEKDRERATEMVMESDTEEEERESETESEIERQISNLKKKREGEQNKARSLFQAAIRGDTKTLLKLLQEDPHILNRPKVEYAGKNNLVHLGALYGHTHFVREILNRKPELAREFNSVGQSPLHLASARGHVGVVTEILRAYPDSCFLRDRFGWTPLHVAAMKGRVKVLNELVDTNRTTAFLLTDVGEPILNLCVTGRRFKALKKLVDLVEDDELVMLKDMNDNTIIHRLSAVGEYEVIDFLVKETGVNVNAVNSDGATPLDVSLECGNGIQGWKTDWILVGAGAKRAGVISGNWKKGPPNGYRGGRFREALLVVAVLTIIVAFQAGINPPGGIWLDTGYHNATTLSPNAPHQSLVQHYAGQSVMSYVDPKRYKDFYMFNIITLASSMLVIILLLSRRLISFRVLDVFATILTFVSILAMSVSYGVSLSFISSDEYSNHFRFAKYLFIFLGILYLAMSVFIASGPRVFRVRCLEIIWFLKRLVLGRSLKLVQSRVDESP